MIGTRIGNYEIVELLGEGGMGEIYAARHVFMGSEIVAKVLLPEMLSKPRVIKRFFDEARAMARLEHPNIVKVYDCGYTDDGRAYILLERLYGETLAVRLRRGPLPVNETLALARQLANTLTTIHDARIVHRDIKPSNLFIEPDPAVPGGQRIKVLDFGVAKIVESVADSTQPGEVVGSLRYMPPEQWLDAGAVDQRADLYALGCIMYYCLCGRPPFIQRMPSELYQAHSEEIPRFSCAVAHTIPAYVEDIVLRLLDKNPAARYQSADELIDALDGCEAAEESGDWLRPPPHERCSGIVTPNGSAVHRASVVHGSRPGASGAHADLDDEELEVTRTSVPHW